MICLPQGAPISVSDVGRRIAGGRDERQEYAAEQMVAKLRESEMHVGKALVLARVCRQLEITDAT